MTGSGARPGGGPAGGGHDEPPTGDDHPPTGHDEAPTGHDDGRSGGPGSPSPAWLGGDAAPLRLLAEIWATVELERALADLGRAAGLATGRSAASDAPAASDGPAGRGEARAATAVDDPLLGARIVVVPADAGRPGIALAEPSTEGRLAAALARHGEGPAGRYLQAPFGLDDVRARAAAARVAISRPVIGPFGPEVLVLDGPVAGAYLILVDPAAVPSRP